MSADKSRVNRCVSAALMTVLCFLGVVILLQVAAMVVSPSKSACTKQVCLSKFLEGPPLFNDEAMAAYLRKNYFLPPAASDYNLSGYDGATEFSASLLQFVADYFKNKRGGVFVDIGAGDGEYQSLTLPLERNLGWTGLLVEPNPRLYKKLLKKGRKAQVTKACVSPFSYPIMMKLSHPRVEAGTQDIQQLTTLGMTKLSQLWHKDNNTQYEEFETQCVPLENLVYAAGITSSIDLLVLDMSGTDLDVLMNTKFDVIPALEMIVIYSHGANITDDVQGYFMEQNMVARRVFGEDTKKNAAFVLIKFDAEKDL